MDPEFADSTVKITQSQLKESADAVESVNGEQNYIASEIARVGHISDRYELKESIGRGGMGVVFRARDSELDRVVAIKVLLFDGASNPVLQERFLREARAMALLDHPNVVKILASGISENGYPFNVMEFLDGKPLSEIIKTRGVLDSKTFKDLFFSVLDGLQHLHKHGIVHRDLKPGNIVFSYSVEGDSIPKIIDFGIARLAKSQEQGSTLTATNVILGSPHYMSPEQCKGQSVDSRSDIYSLACIMYECLSGKQVFSGESVMDVMYKHMTERPAPLQLSGSTGKALSDLLVQCLEKDPDARPQSASALKESLASVFPSDDAGDFSILPGVSSNKSSSWFSQRKLVAFTILLIAILARFVWLKYNSQYPEESNNSKHTNIELSQGAETRLRSTQHNVERLLMQIAAARYTISDKLAFAENLNPQVKELSYLLWQSRQSEKSMELMNSVDQHYRMIRQEIQSSREASELKNDQIRNIDGLRFYVLNKRARALLEKGRYDAAARDLNEAQQISTQVWGRGSRQYVEILHLLMVLKLQVGKPDVVLKLWDEVQSMWQNYDYHTGADKWQERLVPLEKQEVVEGSGESRLAELLYILQSKYPSSTGAERINYLRVFLKLARGFAQIGNKAKYLECLHEASAQALRIDDRESTAAKEFFAELKLAKANPVASENSVQSKTADPHK